MDIKFPNAAAGGGGNNTISEEGTIQSGSSSTTVHITDITSQDDDFYNDKFYLHVVRNDDSVGNAPEGEYRPILDYVSSTGTFTTEAFSALVEPDDKVYVMHESQYMQIFSSIINSLKTTPLSTIKKMVAGMDVVPGDFASSIGTNFVIPEVRSAGIGTKALFKNSQSEEIDAVYDEASGNIVIAFKNVAGSNFGTVIVGSLSGTVMTFGTAVVFESAAVTKISIAYDSANSKVVIGYRVAADGKAIVGTVSGTSISFGTAVSFNSGAIDDTPICTTFDSVNGKVVIGYSDTGVSSHGTAIVGTVSGTSISFGTKVVFKASATTYIASSFDTTASKLVFAYTADSDGKSVVGTVSGTTISFGTEAIFNGAGAVEHTNLVYNPSEDKTIIAYRDNTGQGSAIVGTVSGTSISFGTAGVFLATSTLYTDIAYSVIDKKIVITYQDSVGGTDGFYIQANISGTDVTFESAVEYSGNENSLINSLVYHPGEARFVVCWDNATLGEGYYTAFVVSASTKQWLIAQNTALVGEDVYCRVFVNGDIDNSITRAAGDTYYSANAEGISDTECLLITDAGTLLSA